jgi:hypothetical protein
VIERAEGITPEEWEQAMRNASARQKADGETNKKKNGEDEKAKEAQAVKLIKLAKAATEGLFHTPDQVCYADVVVSGHRETWAVRSKGFRRWLTRKYYEQNFAAPGQEAVQTALNMIEAHAHFDGPERHVHVRVAGLGGYIFLDLCDAEWRA